MKHFYTFYMNDKLRAFEAPNAHKIFHSRNFYYGLSLCYNYLSNF